MNLERFVAVMRPRGSFEAVDLGFLIVRRFWPRLLVAWLLPTLPILLLLAYGLTGLPYLGLPLFWWLKPWFERPMLFVLSRALFGELPRWREVFSWRALGPGLFGDLTLRRFSPHRSLTMPVTLLEGSQTETGRQRRYLIGGKDMTGAGLTFGCWLGEIAFVIALFFLVDLLLPNGFHGFDGFDPESSEIWPTSVSLLIYFSYYLAATLLEPFYVGGGFLLYLQRRTALEGWDVELAFRRMMQRRGKIEAETLRRQDGGLGRGAAALLVGFALGLLALAGPPALRAQDAAAAPAAAEEAAAEEAAGEEGADPGLPAPPEDVHQAIHEIVSQPAFGGTREEETWRFKDGEPLFDPPERESKEPFRLPGLGLPLGALRWLLLGLLAAGVFYFLFRAFRDRARFGGGRGEVKKAGQRRFGLEEDPLAPISDVATRARSALEAGRVDEALAWLYRGAFQELAGRGLLPLRRDFTEDDCLRHLYRKAAGRPAEESLAVAGFEQLFREIAEAWMRVAYGHFEVGRADVARLCVAFERVFRPAPEEAAA